MAALQKSGIVGLCLAAAIFLLSLAWPPLAFPTERSQLRWMDARVTVSPMLSGRVVAGERQTRNGGVLLTLDDQDGKEFNARIKHVFTLLDQAAIEEILALPTDTRVTVGLWPEQGNRVWALTANDRTLLTWEHASAIEPVRVQAIRDALQLIALLLAASGIALLAAHCVCRNRASHEAA